MNGSRIANGVELGGCLSAGPSRSRRTPVCLLVPRGWSAADAVRAADAHLAARGYFESAGAPGEDVHEFDGIPFRVQRGAGRVAAPGPLCGEQSDLVLTEVLGLDRDEIEGLREQGVFG